MNLRQTFCIVALTACVWAVAMRPAAAQYPSTATPAMGEQFSAAPAPPAQQGQFMASDTVQALPAADVGWQQLNPTNGPVEPSFQQNNLPNPVVNSTIISSAPAECGCERLVESTIYTRIDAYDWLEDGNSIEIDIPLVTVGYQYRWGPHRFRTEIFGGDGDFEENFSTPTDFHDRISSTVSYLGTRDEYEYIYDPAMLPNDSIFAGIGTRLWSITRPDGFSKNGLHFGGVEETWWTFYPYLGIETRRTVQKKKQLYGSARIGLTAFTFEELSYNGVKQNPGPGLFLQGETGFRGEHYFLSLYTEGMGWDDSQAVRDNGRVYRQSAASFVTIGLKAGYSF